MSVFGDFLKFFIGGPPRAATPAPQPPPQAPTEGGGFEPFTFPSFEMSEEEKQLLRLQYDRAKKAASIQDDILAALTKLYGRPFAQQYAKHILLVENYQKALLGFQQNKVLPYQAAQIDFATNRLLPYQGRLIDFQENFNIPYQEELIRFQAGRVLPYQGRLIDLAEQKQLPYQAALIDEGTRQLGYRQDLRDEFLFATGQTPEAEAGAQAAREIGALEAVTALMARGLPQQAAAQDVMFNEWMRAARGDVDFDPTLTRAIGAGYQSLDERMRQQIGPAWQTSSAGIEARQAIDESTAAALYNARQQTLDRAGARAFAFAPGGTGLLPAVLTPSPSMSRLLAAQSGVPVGALSAPNLGGLGQGAGFYGGGALPQFGLGQADVMGAGSGILNMATGPIPGAQGLEGLLQQGRLQQGGIEANAALQAALAQYGLQGNLTRDYYNNMFQANRDEYQAKGEALGSLLSIANFWATAGAGGGGGI